MQVFPLIVEFSAPSHPFERSQMHHQLQEEGPPIEIGGEEVSALHGGRGTVWIRKSFEATGLKPANRGKSGQIWANRGKSGQILADLGNT